MRTIRSVTLGILIGMVVLESASGGARRDPFLRVDLNHLPEYRSMWAAKLEVTPFDRGRFVVLPAFEPESSVSVYSYARKDGTSGYRVTYILAVENMWQASDGLRHREKAKAVRTRRIDADISQSTAQLLRKVWLQILQGAHPSASTTPRDWIPIDSPHFEWSLQGPNAPPLHVEANLYIKTTPLLRQFVDLSDITLPAYCKAASVNRPAIARQIDQQANALLKEHKAPQ